MTPMLPGAFMAFVYLLFIQATFAFGCQTEPTEVFMGPGTIVEIDLSGEQMLVSYDDSTSYGFAFFQPSAVTPGDYEILFSPIGPGYAAKNPAEPGNYVATFAGLSLDLELDPTGYQYFDVSGSRIYMIGDPTVCGSMPNVPDSPEIKVDDGLIDGRPARRVAYDSGSGLIGCPVEIYQTFRVCASFVWANGDGDQSGSIPVPGGSVLKTNGNAGVAALADCTRVYCAESTPGSSGWVATSDPAGGGIVESPIRGAIPNFASRVAQATQIPLSSIVSIRIDMYHTIYWKVCGYVIFKAEFVVTSYYSSSSGWAQVGDAEFGPTTITSPPNGEMDADDAAAIDGFANGDYSGAPAL